MTIEAKLAELGVNLGTPAAPAANYIPTVQVGNLVHISGQISNGPDGLVKGRLGDGMGVEAGPPRPGYVQSACWRNSRSPAGETCRAWCAPSNWWGL
jgi:hypothetical protein